VETFTRTKTKAELAAAAMERGLLMVPVNTVADVLASKQLADRDFWREASGPVGDVARVPGPFARFSGCQVGRWAPPVTPGEQTGALYEVAGETQSSIGAQPAAQAALEGLRVLDLSWVYATPAESRADFGATVIHVESPARPDTLRSAQRSGREARRRALGPICQHPGEQARTESRPTRAGRATS
jgi:crotonobetainyl-CoA:carnitine CoA-transferase CaiB-like acyl-CoA transferase